MTRRTHNARPAAAAPQGENGGAGAGAAALVPQLRPPRRHSQPHLQIQTAGAAAVHGHTHAHTRRQAGRQPLATAIALLGCAAPRALAKNNVARCAPRKNARCSASIHRMPRALCHSAAASRHTHTHTHCSWHAPSRGGRHCAHAGAASLARAQQRLAPGSWPHLDAGQRAGAARCCLCNRHCLCTRVLTHHVCADTPLARPWPHAVHAMYTRPRVQAGTHDHPQRLPLLALSLQRCSRCRPGSNERMVAATTPRCTTAAAERRALPALAHASHCCQRHPSSACRARTHELGPPAHPHSRTRVA
jgi:hypothetical protein